jgi:hypothetical protein
LLHLLAQQQELFKDAFYPATWTLQELSGSPTESDELLHGRNYRFGFRRHVQPGIKLSELAGILDQATWLRRREMFNWNEACGSFWIPVGISQEDTTFGIRIFPELESSMGVVYLRVSGSLDSHRFFGLR